MTRIDRDIMVLANPEIAGLPNWVIALVAAGGIAAALSTAAGLLLAISSAISHDLLKGVFTPNISEKAMSCGRPHRHGPAPSCWPAIWGSIRQASRPRWWRWPSVWPRPRLFPTLMMGIFFKR
jgi:cation/acetate symporter